MKRYLPILVIVSAFAISGCNLLFKLPVGGSKVTPTETFAINEGVSDNITVNSLEVTMAPSDGLLTLAGHGNGLATGEIQYNVSEWKPIIRLDGDTLYIEQKSPEDKIVSASREAFNQWDLSLGRTLQTVSIVCQTGNKTLSFADSLPDGLTIRVSAGVGNLRLEFPAGVTANVEIHRGPSSILTEGAWTKDGKLYTSGTTGPVWTVKVDVGVGSITLASK